MVVWYERNHLNFHTPTTREGSKESWIFSPCSLLISSGLIMIVWYIMNRKVGLSAGEGASDYSVPSQASKSKSASSLESLL